MKRKVALLGEYMSGFPPHEATTAAIQHSCEALAFELTTEWVSTEDIDTDLFERFDEIWVAPGSPYRSMVKTLWAIQQAREHRIPCFGTCGGFQHVVIEYARNVLGFIDAQHSATKLNPAVRH